MRGTDGRPFEPGENEAPAWARPLLWVGGAAFAAGAGIRKAAYDAGLLAARRAPVKVISVGNLAVGGTGKTPFTILLLARLVAAGHRPAVVTRGYGAQGGHRPLVVARGTTAAEAGDEPVLLFRRAREAMVIVDPDRVRGAAHAASLGATVVVLDDGFSHRRLARDLDVVLLDALRPFGALLPRGPLREPPSALARADLVVLNQGASDAAPPAPPLPCPVVRVRVVPKGVGPLAGPLEDPSALAGVQVGLLSAIARPRRLLTSVQALGATVVHAEARPDHAPLDDAAVEAFVAAARAAGAQRLITTEKDAVRMSEAARARVEVLRVGHRVIEGEEHLAAALARVGGPP